MPTTKGKGGSMSHHHRPASEYDKATLAQKREYWRTKKREQRARLSERRRNQTQDSRGKKLLHPNSPAVVNSKFSGSFAAFSSPLQSNDESYKPANICPASRSGNTEGESSVEANGSQKERWLEKTNLNKVLPQLPASSYSISAKAAGGDTVRVKCLTRGAVSKALSSLAPSGTQLNTSSLVPPVSVTRIIKGRFTNITPQPMQGALVPKPQLTAQVAVCSQPKLLPTNVTTGMILVSPASIKTEGKAANTTPQSGTKSALVISQRAKGVNSSPPSLMSEEQRAAKRREQWRIKKREQRAKLAAQRAKARERLLGTEMTSQRQTARKTRTMGDAILHHLPSQSFLRGVDQKQCPPPVKTSFTSVKRENDEPQSVTGLAPVNLQADQIKVKNPHPAIKSDVTPVKKAVESQRKLQNHSHLFNVSKGMARCKTPRQRFNEAHKNFMNQRNIRCKSPLLVSIFGSRNIPKIDPNDTPEQIIAKRREYWRIKKREQRAKLSMEMKTRLKEKDSLMRRVKRYQKILEEMRRARTLTHPSDTIGGFIKEDGTVTINISEVPTGQKSEEELHVVSNNNHIRNPQHQPDTKQSSPVGAKQLPPPLRLPQVKVSLPRLGHSVNKPPTLLSDRPRTRLESTTVPHSHSPVIRTVGQLTLTHLQTTPNVVPEGSAAVSNPRGCVVKMAVSNSAPSTVPRDLASREEDRMAKKREYWRIKKREQRAARAVRLKQGVLQARANATLQRRKAQKQVAVTSVPTNHTQNAQTLPNNNSVAVMARASEIKQESEFMPAADLNSQPEQAICPDIKPRTSPPPPPVPQPESDPALSADSQATTLLAVASMKKLLEESLSTVTEYKSEQDNIQIKSEEDVSETGMRPDGTQIVLGKDKVLPVAADQMLEIKSWQPDTDALVQAGSTSFHLKDKPQISEIHPQINEIHPPLPTSSEVVLLPTCEHSSQTPSNLIINLMEPSDGPSSPCRTQRLYAKRVVGHQNCCSPEPPKLHHLPMDQLQQQHCEQPHLNNSALSAKKFSSVVMEHSGLTSLQRKREYWKLMKRQQRARLKARQTERRDDGSSWLKKKSIQAPGLIQTNTVKDVNHPEKPALKPKPSVGSLTAVTSIPTILVVSPTTCNAEQSRDTLQVKLPVTSVYCSSRSEQNKMNVGFTQSESDYLGAPENQQQEMPEQQKWMSRSSDVDSAPCLPTLKPPDNPLSSIDLQPIEPPGQTSNSPLRTIKMPCSQFQSPPHRVEPSTKLAPISTMVPPKPTPGESEEEFLRRKREYWRIKKKEQRARKAIRDKGVTSRRASNNWRPILPAQEIQTQGSSQWMSSSEEPGHLTITSLDNDVGSFPYSYTAPIEDESELLDADYENSNGDEGPVSDTVWRSRYLMDYDPLNQLLVCMVCGELQYSHSLEGVRAHIDEAHPDTLTMHLREKQRILEAWDEQVSQRERFFTSQLQQHSGALADTHRDRVN